MVKIGDIIIAKNNDLQGNFEEGDTLKVTYATESGAIANNLTRPWKEKATILSGEYEVVYQPKSERDSYRVYFLGIPLFKVKKEASE